MPEKVMPGPVSDCSGIREAVCIHTRKIYDSCRDKDCIEDLRFYPKLQYVDVINRALSVKGGSAKLREEGYRVESLAVIDRIEDGTITFV